MCRCGCRGGVRGFQAGVGMQELLQGRIRAPWQGRPCRLTCCWLSVCLCPPCHEHLGAFPFPSPPRVSNRRERIGLREQDCPGGSPNHTEQAPPRVCYSLSFENHQKTHPTLPLAQRCFHAFNNHCIFSPPGTGVQSNSYINSKHLPCTFCVRELC